MMKKISERTTDEGLDILCKVIPCANAILSDAKLKGNLKKAMEGRGEVKTIADRIRFGVERINEFVPLVFNDHRADVYAILAALNGCESEEIKNQGFAETLKQIMFYKDDKDLIEVFTSQGQKRDATSSGSASESTVEN